MKRSAMCRSFCFNFIKTEINLLILKKMSKLNLTMMILNRYNKTIQD